MVSNTLYTDLKTEGDGAQGRRAVGYEATLLGVDDEHLILPREEVVTCSVEAQGVDTDLLSPALGSSEADGEVLQTQVVGGAQEAGRVRVRIRRLEGGKLRLVTDLLPDLVDVVVLGDSQVQHFFVTVLVERDSTIVEVATEGVAEGEVDVDGAPVDVVDKPASEGGVEGLVIDKHITMSDLKGTLAAFAKEMFGEDREVRLRPSYFPFTEPSLEVDISCFKCGGEGCSVCKGTGWIEVLGSGMVHPNVLEAAGVDSTVYGGFAFGLGQDRIAMLKYGIEDIRSLYTNDVRFLSQFTKES